MSLAEIKLRKIKTQKFTHQNETLETLTNSAANLDGKLGKTSACGSCNAILALIRDRGVKNDATHFLGKF